MLAAPYSRSMRSTRARRSGHGTLEASLSLIRGLGRCGPVGIHTLLSSLVTRGVLDDHVGLLDQLVAEHRYVQLAGVLTGLGAEQGALIMPMLPSASGPEASMPMWSLVVCSSIVLPLLDHGEQPVHLLADLIVALTQHLLGEAAHQDALRLDLDQGPHHGLALVLGPDHHRDVVRSRPTWAGSRGTPPRGGRCRTGASTRCWTRSGCGASSIGLPLLVLSGS